MRFLNTDCKPITLKYNGPAICLGLVRWQFYKILSLYANYVQDIMLRITRLGTFCQSSAIQKSFCPLWNRARSLQKVSPTASFFSSSFKMSGGDKPNQKTLDIAENPFFEKYKAKIQHMQDTNPEEYEEKLKELSERLNPKVKALPESAPSSEGRAATPPKVVPPSEEASAGVGMTRSKGLDSVLKLDLIQDKTADEITQIWSQYHSGKDCVYAVLKTEEFQNVMEKSKECPVFVYPIPRDDGYEFILSQFDRHDVYFTPLAMFQLVRENAPPCLTVNHYTELMEDKGIVLMAGQYDDKVLKQQLALSLVQQMSIFYGRESKFYDIVHRFNYEPEKFQYQEIVDALKSLPQNDIK